MKKPNFLNGRYGFDKLFFAVTGLCVLIALLGYTLLWRIPHVDTEGVLSAAGLLMIINCSRVFSKKISSHKAENIRFTVWANKIFKRKETAERRGMSAAKKSASGNGRPKASCGCGQPLDIPAGSGKHIVMCPKCGRRNLIDV